MAEWYRKIKQGIPSKNIFKKSIEEAGKKCPKCSFKTNTEDIIKNFFICKCGHHFRITSVDYFHFLFDDSLYKQLFEHLSLKDGRGFHDLKPYYERLEEAQEKSGFDESIAIATGKMSDMEVVLAVMDFSFIGGTLGSVMGEKLAKAIDFCISNQYPLIVVSRSGGARLMESVFALMQMTKLSARLLQLADAKIPFISVLTDPTIGGVTASVGMKGDINIAEPNALIAYTAPKILRESIGKEPPKGFQRSEFVMDCGFLDMIVTRDKLKDTITNFLSLILEKGTDQNPATADA